MDGAEGVNELPIMSRIVRIETIYLLQCTCMVYRAVCKNQKQIGGIESKDTILNVNASARKFAIIDDASNDQRKNDPNVKLIGNCLL